MLENSARALALDPNLATAHASRGLAFWGAQRPAEAEAEYRKALEIDPNLYEANYFYGRLCRAVGRFTRAVELFERAAEVRPTDYKSVGLVQSAYELLGQEDAAAKAGRRCLERAERELASRPENAVAAIHAAMALAALGEKVRSRHYIQMARRQPVARIPQFCSTRPAPIPGSAISSGRSTFSKRSTPSSRPRTRDGRRPTPT